MPAAGRTRRTRAPALAWTLAVLGALTAACGASAPAQVPTPTAPASAIPAPGPATGAGARLQSWPEFGLDPQRSDASDLSSGITAANVGHLHRLHVALPGTVDSSPIYLHGVVVAGAARDVVIATTSYGRTLAIDAADGRILWTFTPRAYSSWAGSARITTASPVADPGGGWVYAASPNGLVHKLTLAGGAEAPGWPVRVTLDSSHEKLAAALNVAGPYVIAATGGYLGDGPPYQGHVVLIDRDGAGVRAIFNTLCAARRGLMHPGSCGSSDSAILARAGVVVEPGGTRVLLATGNGPYDGRGDFGDSVLELTLPQLALRQTFTPADQAHLNESDTDLGSSAPVLLGDDRVAVAGKDGIIRVLALSRLDGHPRGGAAARARPLGGELQQLSIPGGGQLFTTPAVWRRDGRTTMFVAGENGTGAYILRGGRLYRAWQNTTAGTSPVLAGGLLYVYDPAGGGIRVYEPGSPSPIARLAGQAGHWNSPIVADGHVVEPEGNANDHAESGAMEIFSAP